ncbi:MAG: chain length-determining protein [Azoarcus sp.]|jgi:polysaccharide chain length determinant protein (PEP-CTERM system associated)|nr:chain length-determining protein [Azoarcus sp.]
MEELLRQIQGYLRGMWRFRWWGLALTWGVGLIGCVVVALMPDKYESTARVYVDTKSLLNIVLRNTGTQPPLDQQLTILGKTLISRPNMRKLIDRADLDFTIHTDAQREALTDHLIKTIEVRRAGEVNLYTLSYADPKPARAQRVVSELVNLFVEAGVKETGDDKTRTVAYLDEQIKNYDQKLAEAENRLKQFKLDNFDQGIDGEGGSVGRLMTIRNKLAEYKLSLIEAQREQSALYGRLKQSKDRQWVPGIDDRLSELRLKLDELRLHYTEDHPDVRNTQNMISDLEKQRESFLKRSTSDGALDGLNPAAKLALAEADAKVEAATVRVEEYERQLADAQDSGKKRTTIEAELTRLNRDYEMNKKKYDELISERNNLTPMDSESTVSGINFQLIDPANLPTKPAAPNRLMLMPLVGLLALAAGAALSFLISQIRPAFLDAHSLREVLGLPVLGVVSMLVTREQKRRRARGLMTFGGGVAGFVLCVSLATFLLFVIQK